MAGYEVDQCVEVEFREGRDESSLKPVKGWLGVGHIDGDDGRREIFGEVMYGDKDYRAFTMRCYHLDEYFSLDRIAREGLVLDSGTSRDRVEVPAGQIQQALRQLRAPVATLEPGETVTILRNPEHPAWKDKVEGEYDTEYVLPESFEPLVARRVQVTEKHGGKIRGANGFWYGPDGEQDGSSATIAVSERALDGTVLPVQIESAAEVAAPDASVVRESQKSVFSGIAQAGALVPEPGAPGQDRSASEPDRFTRALSTLDERYEVLDQALRQWNPHNEKMQPRIREASRLLTLAESDRDNFTQLQGSLDRFDFDADERERRETSYAAYLEQAGDELGRGMTRLGVRVPGPCSQADAGLSAADRQARVARVQADLAERTGISQDERDFNDTFEGAGR